MKRLVKFILVLCIVAGLILAGRQFYLRMAYPQKYTEYVEQYSTEYGVSESLVYAVIKCESGFDPDAESPIGARGLMQITPDTFAWAQTKMPGGGEQLGADALWDEQVNIRYGVFLLCLHLNEFSDVGTAVAAYHAGRGQVNSWLADPECAPDGKTLETIPYKDTRTYVERVKKTIQIYKDLYKAE